MIKTAIKAVLAGAVFVSANSFAALTTSDLNVYVYDSTINTSFAGSTGVSISSLLTTAQIAAAQAANRANPVSDSTMLSAPTTLAAPAGLAAFLSAHAADHLVWTIFAGDTATSIYAPGGGDHRYVFTSASGSLLTPGATTTGGNINTALGALAQWNYTITAGASSTTAGLGIGGNRGTDALNKNFISTQYPAGNLVGSANYLYEFAASSGASTNSNVFLATSTITLNANGTFSLTSLQTTQAPLPAAVWLLGSGLMGLIGVGRRRRAV